MTYIALGVAASGGAVFGFLLAAVIQAGAKEEAFYQGFEQGRKTIKDDVVMIYATEPYQETFSGTVDEWADKYRHRKEVSK